MTHTHMHVCSSTNSCVYKPYHCYNRYPTNSYHSLRLQSFSQFSLLLPVSGLGQAFCLQDSCKYFCDHFVQLDCFLFLNVV